MSAAMLNRRGIYRLFQREITEIGRLRELEASELLKKLPKPDAFIGHKRKNLPREVMPKAVTDWGLTLSWHNVHSL